MTKEHIWSDWLSSIMGTQQNFHSQSLLHVRPGPGNVVFIGPQTSRTKQGSIGQVKVRNVCRDCNGGWMSRIVESAKPAAQRLIQGERFELSEEDQKAVTKWLAVMTIMAEFTDRSSRGVTDEMIRLFYSDQSSLDQWSIVVARYRGLRFSPHRYLHFGGRCTGLSRSGQKFDLGFSQASILVLGNLATLCFSSTNPRIMDFYQSISDAAGFASIWPLQKNMLDISNIIKTDDEIDEAFNSLFGPTEMEV